MQKQVLDALKEQNAAKYTKDGELIVQFEKLLQDEEVKRIKEGQKVEPVIGKLILKIFFPLTWPYQIEKTQSVCELSLSLSHTLSLSQIWYLSTTKNFHIMTLG